MIVIPGNIKFERAISSFKAIRGDFWGFKRMLDFVKNGRTLLKVKEDIVSHRECD